MTPPHRLIALACVAALIAALAGCDDEDFGDAERKEVRKVLQTGIDLDSDPYVQAETLRVIELIADPSHNHFAEGLVESSEDPMVRAAALRVLMANGADDVRRTTLSMFSNSSPAGQKVILNTVLEHGPPPLKREVTSRALRASDAALRREAFLRGPLERLRRAHEDGNTRLLENTLFPEVGQHVTNDDEVLAAAALEALAEAGQQRRAQPLLDTLADTSAERDERLAAARTLRGARIESAEPIYSEILESVRIDSEGAFVVPRRIDKELVRAATLGLVALGEDEYVRQAQGYLKSASTDETLEVLDALSTNPSEEAAVSLKIAMQDARKPVRHQAISAFSDNSHAEAKAFIRAMRGADFESQKLAAAALSERFAAQWAESLSEDLKDEDRRVETLDMLGDLLPYIDHEVVLGPLDDQLYELASLEDPEVSALAALLLVRVADDQKSHDLLAQVEAPEIRYAFLEHLLRSDPKAHIEVFRQNFYSDLYAIRLISAAGMLLAFDAGAAAKGEAEE
jgi:HEAT repeat protein